MTTPTDLEARARELLRTHRKGTMDVAGEPWSHAMTEITPEDADNAFLTAIKFRSTLHGDDADEAVAADETVRRFIAQYSALRAEVATLKAQVEGLTKERDEWKTSRGETELTLAKVIAQRDRAFERADIHADERDAAQSRIGELEGALTEARDQLWLLAKNPSENALIAELNAALRPSVGDGSSQISQTSDVAAETRPPTDISDLLQSGWTIIGCFIDEEAKTITGGAAVGLSTAEQWCVHVLGPDDIVPMPDINAAIEYAHNMNAATREASRATGVLHYCNVERHPVGHLPTANQKQEGAE